MGFPGRFLACVLALAVVLCGCRTIEKAEPRKRAAEHVRRIAAVAPFCGIVVNRPGGGEPYETRGEPGSGGRRKAVRVARAGSY